MEEEIKKQLDEAHAEETAGKEVVIEVDDLHYKYPNYEEGREDEEVLKGLNLKVYDGEFIAILGHNGSGKSTLAKLLNAQMLPTKGDIKILGMNTRSRVDLWNIRSSCGMVFQNPDNQMVATIVEEDVAFGPENLGVPMPELRQRVDNALKAVEMYENRRRPAHKLSGGQKQRVAIAGILAMLPRCIIMDEPTAMLDPIGRREIISTIGELNKKAGKTILLITHNMEEAIHADRILVVSDGEIVLEGKPRDVFSQVQTMRDLELDVPQVTELAYRLNREGYNINPNILDIDEFLEAVL